MSSSTNLLTQAEASAKTNPKQAELIYKQILTNAASA